MSGAADAGAQQVAGTAGAHSFKEPLRMCALLRRVAVTHPCISHMRMVDGSYVPSDAASRK